MINTELKFHQSTTTPDRVGLMPISRDCEDDECVDGSAISPATVYNMCMFLGLIVFEDEHQVVHMYSCLYRFISEVTTVSISAYGTS